MRYTSSRHNKGFTFIELIIVVVITPVIALALFGAFSSGLEIWNRIIRQAPAEDVLVFFDAITRDLRNSFMFSGINFSGQEDSIAFPTVVQSARMERTTVGEVRYFFEPGTNEIKREKKDFSHVDNEEEGALQRLVGGVASFSLRYYYYDGEKQEFQWKEDWLAAAPPRAVRIEVELDDGTEKNRFTKTVSIPVGG